MKRGISVGFVLALLTMFLLCLPGCGKLGLKQEIDYDLLADKIAERVDERLEMRERERSGGRIVKKSQESPPAESVSTTPAITPVKEKRKEEEKAEAQVESTTVIVEQQPEVPAVEALPEIPKVPPKERTIDIDGIELVLVEIPAGEFLMGSPAGVGMDHEHPQHKVTITHPFYLGKYEVTQAQWTKIMGSNPSYFKGGNRPVETMSWDDVQKFITKLNAMTGQNFRLPTEAEWEYATRAGSDTKYYFSGDEELLDEYAWSSSNSKGKTNSVGQRKPNNFGLYDMLGNVWEWCADWYGEAYYSKSPQDDPAGPASGKYRVLRGGSYIYSGVGLRVANRYYQPPTYNYADTGFRIAMDAQ